jgi:hypothetical protein
MNIGSETSEYKNSDATGITEKKEHRNFFFPEATWPSGDTPAYTYPPICGSAGLNKRKA